jgi:hypothetical protein
MLQTHQQPVSMLQIHQLAKEELEVMCVDEYRNFWMCIHT